MKAYIIFLLLCINFSSTVPMELSAPKQLETSSFSTIKRSLALYTRELRMQYHNNPECCKLIAGTFGTEVALSCLTCGPWGSLCLNALLGGTFLAMYSASHESDERRRIRDKRDLLEFTICCGPQKRQESEFQQDAFLESDPDSLKTQNTPMLIFALDEYEKTTKDCDRLSNKLETMRNTIELLKQCSTQDRTHQEKNRSSVLLAEEEFKKNTEQLDLQKDRISKLTSSLTLLKKYNADLNQAIQYFQEYEEVGEYPSARAWLLQNQCKH